MSLTVTSCTILTWFIQLTLVDLSLTVVSLVSRPAETRVLSDTIHTRGSVLTRTALTLVNVGLTLFP